MLESESDSDPLESLFSSSLMPHFLLPNLLLHYRCFHDQEAAELPKVCVCPSWIFFSNETGDFYYTIQTPSNAISALMLLNRKISPLFNILDNYVLIVKPASFSKRAPTTNVVVQICCCSSLACRNSRTIK